MDCAEKVKKGGQVGVIPTDTLYGVITSAFNKDAVDSSAIARSGQGDERAHKACAILADNET